MPKQIDREKLDKYLRDYLEYLISIDGEPSGSMSIEKVRLMLNDGQFDAPEAAGWIDVNRELPIRKGSVVPEILQVLVYKFPIVGRKDGIIDMADFHPMYNRFFTTYGHFLMENVTHWKPLPSPPAPEKDDE